MIKFLPLKADIKNNSFENIQYLSFVLKLLFKNKNLLADDYFPQDEGELLDFIIGEINAVYPWFVVGVIKNIPVGAAWITHWHRADGNKFHSCQLHACIDKKFWGETSLFAIDELIKFLHLNTGVVRIQMEIPEFNTMAINYAKRANFIEEGLIRCATFKNGKPLNHILLSRILTNRGEF